ncbi:MAG: hypothetical protein QW156_04425 [Candidatus Aenigmatarchaeota archaeon]
MVKEADTRIIWRKKGEQFSAYIYLPAKIVLDSAFPFLRDTEEVKIRIDGKRLVIESE